MITFKNNDEIARFAIDALTINIIGDYDEQSDLEESLIDFAVEQIQDNLTLSMVEEYANFWRSFLIGSKEQLSNQFDEMVDELSSNGSDIDTDDTCMINEWFNNWTDGLCTEGKLHELQLNQYEYIGKYSD